VIAQSITSTGSLGNVYLNQGGSNLALNITASNIFGNIDLKSPLLGTLQTTGIRTDPITAAQSTVPADIGVLFVVTTNNVPVLTNTTYTVEGSGVVGSLICGGNLVSQVNAGGGAISGSLIVGGNITGTLAKTPDGHSVLLGGVQATGPMTGTINAGGSIVGLVNVGQVSGSVHVTGSILGTLTFTPDGQPLLLGGFQSNALMAGQISVGGNVSDLNVGQINGAINIAGNLTGTTATQNGQTVLLGGLVSNGGNVSGEITILGNVSGPLMCGAITGAVGIGGSLAGPLTVKGPVNGHLIIAGNVSGALTVNGAVTGQLIVLGATSGALSINGVQHGGVVALQGNATGTIQLSNGIDTTSAFICGGSVS
jgi:hypothetical protein